jgi:hypothetical protein
MSRLKIGVGVAVMSALCVCAVGVGSASALTAHQCENTGGSGIGTGTRYETSSCTAVNQTSGNFETVRVAGKNSGKVTPGPTGVSTLAATVAGVKFKISCTGESGTAELENTGSGTSSQVLGSAIVVNYEGCTVVEPKEKGCKVPSTITTNSLKAETPKETMKTVYTPTTGETFVTIVVSGCSSEALNGSKPVTGSATSLVPEGVMGELQEFTSTSGSALKFGGQAATFISANKLCTNNGTPIYLETP